MVVAVKFLTGKNKRLRSYPDEEESAIIQKFTREFIRNYASVD